MSERVREREREGGEGGRERKGGGARGGISAIEYEINPRCSIVIVAAICSRAYVYYEAEAFSVPNWRYIS